MVHEQPQDLKEGCDKQGPWCMEAQGYKRIMAHKKTSHEKMWLK